MRCAGAASRSAWRACVLEGNLPRGASACVRIPTALKKVRHYAALARPCQQSLSFASNFHHAETWMPPGPAQRKSPSGGPRAAGVRGRKPSPEPTGMYSRRPQHSPPPDGDGSKPGALRHGWHEPIRKGIRSPTVSDRCPTKRFCDKIAGLPFWTALAPPRRGGAWMPRITPLRSAQNDRGALLRAE